MEHSLAADMGSVELGTLSKSDAGMSLVDLGHAQPCSGTVFT